MSHKHVNRCMAKVEMTSKLFYVSTYSTSHFSQNSSSFVKFD